MLVEGVLTIAETKISSCRDERVVIGASSTMIATVTATKIKFASSHHGKAVERSLEKKIEKTKSLSQSSESVGSKRPRLSDESFSASVTSERADMGVQGVASTFRDLGLSNWIVKSCSALGMNKPTPIQQNCIPPALHGRNVIGSALTGSGKTAAFALPILEKLSKNPYGIFALVITPTRELAAQIVEQFLALGAKLPVRVCMVVGGLDMMKQSVELDRLPHVVICTPGRMADIMNGARPPKLSKLKFLVLDEADRLFEKTFARDIDFIVSRLPKKIGRLCCFLRRCRTTFDRAKLSQSTNHMYGLIKRAKQQWRN